MIIKVSVNTLVISSIFLLASCATTQHINSDATKFTAINTESISYTILKSNDEKYEKGLIRDLSLPSYSKFIETGKYERLLYEDFTDKSFIVHRRTDNGSAGSGIKYKINYSVEDFEHSLGYRVILKPISYYEYQQGLIGKFPIPNYDINDLRKTLSSAQVYYSNGYAMPFKKPTTLASGVVDFTNIDNYDYKNTFKIKKNILDE